MSPRGLSLIALLSALASGGFAFSLWPRSAPAAQKLPPRTPHPIALLAPNGGSPPSAPSRFATLQPLSIENQTTRERRELKLYDAQGNLDESAAAELDGLLCDARLPKQRETTRINRRTLQLLFKAAYHFNAAEVEVVSAYRKPGRRSEGPHGTGSAVDFRLKGVPARELASYLRDIPRTGVGVYTHPKTQYVHLDSREHSFHWLDASPPRRHWREKSIGARNLVQRDASYRVSDDLP